MSLIVQKFGGSSVRDAQRIQNVAGIIADTYRAGNQVLVVLSAQGDTTDDLIEKAKEINPHASKREMDMLLSTGEQISIALCAMALEGMGLPVVSLAAWQVGIQTTSAYSDARIKKIDPERIQRELDKNKIVLVAGFQGVNRFGDVTTLGRGGSDTSAVALAAGLVEKGTSYTEAARIFIDAVKDMKKRFLIGDTIKEIKEEDIPKLAHYADKEANPLYPVPVLMDSGELEQFYYAVSEQ